MKNELMIFEGYEVEVFELNGEVLFNPYHVGACLDLGDSAVRMAISKMNGKQVVKLRNSNVKDIDFRKLHNTGENFLTESGVYKLVFKSNKPNAEEFTDWVTDEVLPSLRKTGSYKMSRPEKKEKLPSINMMVKNITGALKDAGVDKKFIAAEAIRIYSDAGYEVKVPIISNVPVLWDCTGMAKKLGILSKSGNPHDKAVSAIIQKLDVHESEIVKTAFSRNGHDGVTVQYTESVFQKVQHWLKSNDFPGEISYMLSNGAVNKCKIVYQGVA